MQRMLRRKEVLSVTGLSASTQYREEKAGRFPARRKLSAGIIVGWPESDVLDWLTNRQAVTSGGEKMLQRPERSAKCLQN